MAPKDKIHANCRHRKFTLIIRMVEDSSSQMGNPQMNQVVSDSVGELCVQRGLKSTQCQTFNLNLKQVLQ